MDVPVEVLVHNELAGMKGTQATLLGINEEGFYELKCTFGENQHRVLLPIGSTVLIARNPEEVFASDFEIERGGT